MQRKLFIVYHPSQLNRLSTLPFNRTPGLGKIVLKDFDHPHKAELEKELNRLYYTCGCDTGAKAFIAGLLISIPSAIYLYRSEKLSTGNILLYHLAGIIGIALLGKLYGLVGAEKKLRQTVKKIQSEWKADWPQSERMITCG